METFLNRSGITKTRSQKHTRTKANWLVRILSGIVGLLIVLVVGGLVYQAIGAAGDARAFPAPGQRIAVNGVQLHLNCTGEGSPTVILESMAGNNSVEWGWIQPEISKSVRVCSYDRAGRVWSDALPNSRPAAQVAADLHTLLESANVKPPFVFVGHSIGGIYAHMYATQYPGEVVGMVLMDAAHPDQVKQYPEMRAGMENFLQEGASFPLIARLGLFRLYFALGGEIDFGDLPAQQRNELKAQWSLPEFQESNLQETRAALELYDNPPALGTLGNMPLIVVTATENQTNGWADLQNQLAALSTNSEHRIAQGAAHASLAFNPQHAQYTIQAIQDLLKLVR